jgi:hypothetical protein
VGVHIGCQSLRIPVMAFLVLLVFFYLAYDTRGNDMSFYSRLKYVCTSGIALGKRQNGSLLDGYTENMECVDAKHE